MWLSILGIFESWVRIGELGSFEGKWVGLSSCGLVKKLTLGLLILGIFECLAKVVEVGCVGANGVELDSCGLVEGLTFG